MKVILIKKQKLNRKNCTPLHYAIENNSKEIGELLITKGADITVKDIIYQILEIFFKIKVIEKRSRALNHMKCVPLHYAAMNNSKEVGEILISKGANINIIVYIL